MSRLTIGILDYSIDLSVGVYTQNLVRSLEALGVRFLPFLPRSPVPKSVDVLWDPRLAGGTPPWHALRQSRSPVVASLFDVAPLGLPPWEYYPSVQAAFRGYIGVAKRIYAWYRTWRGHHACVVTISEFSRREIKRALGGAAKTIIPIPLGVDPEVFRPLEHSGDAESHRKGYFLHVSQYQRKKNVERIIAAHSKLTPNSRPELKLVLSRYPVETAPAGVSLTRGPLELDDLAALYREATAFVFPSLHEGFGLPILEAMASGCPVITANSTGCSETAGLAAIRVNPRSVEEIAAAMQRLINSPDERTRLRELGLERAKQLSWELCARRHLEVFEWVVGGKTGPAPDFLRSQSDGE